MTDAIHILSELLARLPGVGRRSAMRLTFHLLKCPDDYLKTLGQAISIIRDVVKPCSVCRNLTETDPCPICSDAKRDRRTVCVVASVPDLYAIEETNSFRGTYYVLHGLFAPLDGVGPDSLQVDKLRERVDAEHIEEVIIATRPSVEGEATALLVQQTLANLPAKVTRIASGISYGGELEYADRMTLGRALDGRREM
jgi:recombination protein RecR